MAASSSLVPDRLRLPLCFLGVFVCYFYYGILQEKITRGKYGEGAKQETFTFALTLVFIQCVINAVFAKILIQFFDTARVDRTRSWLYAACSVSYLGAMVSSNSALQFVNYPTQVLGKSCKPIPVMLLGVTLLRKKYPMAKYLCVLLIVAGVALFMYKPKKVVGIEEHTVGYGELLLLLSLTLDGLTGVSQDHMRAHYQTGSNHMMLNINLWSTLLLGAGKEPFCCSSHASAEGRAPSSVFVSSSGAGCRLCPGQRLGLEAFPSQCLSSLLGQTFPSRLCLLLVVASTISGRAVLGVSREDTQ
uniref:Solute carrier family 35 member B1 n=1 Tax=Sus scrofa TaxID=9823 RepID=A0A8D1IFZ8_PIG